MTQQQSDIDILRVKFEQHVEWSALEHAKLRNEHETDFRALIQAVNDLRLTVSKEANKVIMFSVGAAVSVVGGIITQLIVNHIH